MLMPMLKGTTDRGLRDVVGNGNACMVPRRFRVHAHSFPMEHKNRARMGVFAESNVGGEGFGDSFVTRVWFGRRPLLALQSEPAWISGGENGGCARSRVAGASLEVPA